MEPLLLTHLSAPQVIFHVQELARLGAEAMSAIEARNVSNVGFYDCSGASIGAIMGMMEAMTLDATPRNSPKGL